MRRWASSADRFRTFNVNAAVSALELIDLVKPLVPGITTPTLIIQGKLDSVVEPGTPPGFTINWGPRRRSSSCCLAPTTWLRSTESGTSHRSDDGLCPGPPRLASRVGCSVNRP